MKRGGVKGLMGKKGKEGPHEFRPPVEGAKPREKAGGRWLVKDCCGIATIFFVWFFVIWPVCFVGHALSKSWPDWARILVTTFMAFCAVMALWTHTKCMTTNPGTVPLRSLEAGYPRSDETLLSESEGMRFCVKCDGPKPPRAHHCSTCNRCILKMDHHCPWMNTCIGMYNLKYFMLFLFYVFLLSSAGSMSVAGTFGVCAHQNRGGESTLRGLNAVDVPAFNVLPAEGGTRRLYEEEVPNNVINRAVKRGRSQRRRKSNNEIHRGSPGADVCGLAPHNLLVVCLMMLEAVVFGIFSLVMLIDCIGSARTGDSQIDELGMHHGKEDARPHQIAINEMKEAENRTCKSGMMEFCGSKPSPKWMLPIRGSDVHYYNGLTELDQYVLSATYWDRYVVPRARSVQNIEMGDLSPQ